MRANLVAQAIMGLTHAQVQRPELQEYSSPEQKNKSKEAPTERLLGIRKDSFGLLVIPMKFLMIPGIPKKSLIPREDRRGLLAVKDYLAYEVDLLGIIQKGFLGIIGLL